MNGPADNIIDLIGYGPAKEGSDAVPVAEVALPVSHLWHQKIYQALETLKKRCFCHVHAWKTIAGFEVNVNGGALFSAISSVVDSARTEGCRVWYAKTWNARRLMASFWRSGWEPRTG